EQALQVIRRLGLPMHDAEQQFRRAVFNVIARNHDDHVKNIAFLMNKEGRWRLAPAFDVAYSYNPTGAWTSRHQMSIHGKRDRFAVDHLLALADSAAIKPARAKAMLEEIDTTVGRWQEFAAEASVPPEDAKRIA